VARAVNFCTVPSQHEDNDELLNYIGGTGGIMKMRSSFRYPIQRVATKPVIPAAQQPQAQSSTIDGAPEVDLVPIPLNIGQVLVPLDFSDHSQRALQYAVSFAAQFSAKLTLLHVVEPVVYPSEFGYAPVAVDALNKSSLESAQERLDAFAAKKVPARLRNQTLVRTGTAFDEIARAARDVNADIIILSTHGYTGLKHVMLGSTAERVVRHSPCPVLVLRQRIPTSAGPTTTGAGKTAR
jgi:universal stress protein A